MIWNVPNILSLSRLIGVPFLFYLIHLESHLLFIIWYILLGLTDYLDGKIARAWDQVSDFGSMLDSVADLAFYISTAYFIIVLFPEYITPNLPFLYGMFALLGLSIIVSKIRAGRILFLHTHLSRLNGVLVFFAFILSFYLNTTFFIATIIAIYYLAFTEVILIFWRYGNISPDTRTIIGLRNSQKNLSV
jgi:phosphatidylglycerophosphate synthase